MQMYGKWNSKEERANDPGRKHAKSKALEAKKFVGKEQRGADVRLLGKEKADAVRSIHRKYKPH